MSIEKKEIAIERAAEELCIASIYLRDTDGKLTGFRIGAQEAVDEINKILDVRFKSFLEGKSCL